MAIKNIIAEIKYSKDLITELLKDEFNIDKVNSELLYDRIIKPHIDKIKADSYIVAELPYIDKVYRDSYYNYYSSKLNCYKRDTIRISFFEGIVNQDDFRVAENIKRIEKAYLGFIVLRPTEPSLIGRSVLSPKALLTNGFKICKTTFQTTVNSVKFEVKGFPHSSQDAETISCAETTLWALMEYFGNKYPEYRPVLPSDIIKTLKQVSSERQVPSKGLNIQQMSFALKEYGFGTRIYSRHQYGSSFENLLSCYIESGIPVIVAMENRPAGNIGHALLCIGHEDLRDGEIDKAKEIDSLDANLIAIKVRKNIRISDYDDIDKKFVFIDDNQPAYQVADLKQPAIHYSDSQWHTCQITYFIAPLYSKIYLEAYEAKSFFTRFLLQGPIPLNDNSDIVLRCFLASGRSYKDSIAKNTTMQIDLKEMILETSMPKFVWVAELTDKKLLKTKEAKGLIIIDATEANLIFNKPLILAAYDDNVICFDQNLGKLINYALSLRNFCIFENNLQD